MHTRPLSRLGLPALVAIVALLAACGGGGTKETKAPSPAASPAAASSATAGPSTTATQASRTFTDDTGKTLPIAQPPKRVVALSPSIVEILYAVDAPPVARPTAANYPAVAASLPTVGSSYQVNVEQ